jgi:hypothetical protein
MRILSSLSLLLIASSAIAQFQPGNLVVLRVGDGVNPLSSASQAMFLDEYTTTGSLVSSLALPTAANGANLPIACSGSATSEGNLQLAANGQFLVCAGYAAAPGVASIASSAAGVTPRVVARIGLDGSIDTSTSINNAISGNNVRSATTDNGTDFFVAGANSGIQHVVLGATTSTALHVTNPQNNRTVAIWNNQLYTTAAAQGFHSVNQVGTGVSTLPGQTVTTLPGLPTASGPSPYDFFFADPNTLYIADDRNNNSTGGIYKYTLVNGVWTLQYLLAQSTALGCRGLTGVVNQGVVTLYATNTLTSTNNLLSVTDLGPNSTFTSLATAATNTVFRGLRLVTSSSLVNRIPHGCGPTTISGAGVPSLGGTFTTTLGNINGLPFLGYGFAVNPTPLCPSCTLGHEWSVALFGLNSTFQVPTNPVFTGLVIGIQGADLLGTGGCQAPMVTLTDTLTITLQ